MTGTPDTILTLIDVQTKLTAVMSDREKLVNNLVKLVRGLRLLKVPIIWLEQNPGKMGPTIPELQQLLTEQSPIEKMSFSCCGSNEYMKQLKQSSHCRRIMLAGIETHVCVYQTCNDLIRHGYDVEIVADATSSRNPVDKEIALAKTVSHTAIGSGRASYTSVETILFELMQSAEHPAFREMLHIVK